MRSKSASDRRSAVRMLLEIDAREAVRPLEEAVRRSRKAMGDLAEALDAQDDKVMRAIGFYRYLEANGEVTMLPYAWEQVEKQRAAFQLLTNEMNQNLAVYTDVEDALPKFRSNGAIGLIESGAKSEPDPLIRQMYIDALGAAGRRRSIPVLLQLLKDRDGRARALAAQSLRPFIGDARVLEALPMLLKDKQWAVRLRASETIARAPLSVAIPLLVEAIVAETGQMARSLDALLYSLTGQSFAEAPRAWQDWWQTNKTQVNDGSFVPAKASSDQAGSAQAGLAARAAGATQATFFRIPVPSLNVLFALDYSGSMSADLTLDDARLNEVREKLGLPETRLGYVKAEVIRAIRSLPEQALFNVLIYSDEAHLLSKRPLRARTSTKRRAVTWILKQETGNMTNMWDALRTSFADHHEGSAGKGRFPLLPDTILFLTDGVPTRGRFQAHEPLRTLVRQWNRAAGTVIHCVGVGEGHDERLLRALAEETYGYYVSLEQGGKSVRQRRREVPVPEQMPHVGQTLEACLIQLEEGDAEEQSAAAALLVRLGPQAAPAAAVLSTLLANPEERVDQAVRKALVSIGAAAVASVEPLLQSERGALIQAALDVLRRLGPESIPALPAVLALALDEEGDWRVPALDSLGAMGSAAKEAQTPLRALRKSRQKEVSNAAKRALSEIRDG